MPEFDREERLWQQTLQTEQVNQANEVEQDSLDMLNKRLNNLNNVKNFTAYQAEAYYPGANYYRRNDYAGLDEEQQKFIDNILDFMDKKTAA